MKTVTRIAQEVVLESRLSAREIAARLNKPYPTLMRELNPYDTGAKLGVETLMEILRVTRNVEVLRYMAKELGYRLEPLPAENLVTRFGGENASRVVPEAEMVAVAM